MTLCIERTRPLDSWSKPSRSVAVPNSDLSHKSDLSIRPVWHQRADRVQAHILVCFLAYVMWKTLERWMDRAGIGSSPRTLLDEKRVIRSTDVVLPTEEPSPRELRIRCVVRPEKPAQVLLDP